MKSRVDYPPSHPASTCRGRPPRHGGVDECENGESSASARCSPFSGRRIIAAKLPNENFGAKQNHLEGTTALAVGLHDGFTLIELLLVLFLFLLLAGLAIPNFKSSFGLLKLKTAVSDLHYLMQYAQSRAVISERQVRVNFDEQNRTYWLTQEKEQEGFSAQEQFFELIHGTMGREKVIPREIKTEMEGSTIAFYPDGTIEKKQISLCLAAPDQPHCQIISTSEQRGQIDLLEEKGS